MKSLALCIIPAHGFIPWDDDIDFGMLRNEYERFLEVTPRQLSENFFLQTWDNDDYYPYGFAKVRKKNTLYIEAIAQESNAHNELYVDVFPYDGYPQDLNDRKEQKRKELRYHRCMLMHSGFTPWANHKGVLERILVRVKYLPYMFYSVLISRDEIKKRYNRIMQKHDVSSCKELCEHTGGSVYGKRVMKKDWFDSYVWLQFEDTTFSAPKGYKECLEASYGDYMKLPPEEKRGNRHNIIKVKL